MTDTGRFYILLRADLRGVPCVNINRAGSHGACRPVVGGIWCLGLVDCLVCGVAAHFADSVFEHYVLLEEVVYGHFTLGVVVHRALEEEREEALCAVASGAGCEVTQEHEVEAKGSGED